MPRGKYPRKQRRASSRLVQNDDVITRNIGDDEGFSFSAVPTKHGLLTQGVRDEIAELTRMLNAFCVRFGIDWRIS